ncbi:MFS transporter [Weissella minor]|uniref:Macrolide-efflux protein n=1 Tax=Weissella minor TaxID=1620 RepID=A0A0R2JPN5_9LACO|nr:MFS transporter [Weissella minor]KRN76029.1 macrolide-efflux protein [Weissella minor]
MYKLFRNRQFALLALSFLSSSIANWVYKLALPIIILNQTGSALHAASLFGFSFIPWILFSLFGGVIADSFTKSWVLFIGNLFSTFAALMLVFAMQLQPLNMIAIYSIVFILSSADPLVHPSFQSIIPEIVDAKDYVNANAIIQTIENTLSIIGPLVGGGIVTILGGIQTLWFSVAFLSVAAVASLLIQSAFHQRSISFQSIYRDAKCGFEYVLHEKVILSGSLMFFFANLGTNMFESNFMYFMTKELKMSVLQTTAAMAISGTGALIAGPIGSRWIPKFKSGLVLVSSTVAAGLTTLLLNTTHNYLLLGIILGLVSFFGTLNVITYFTLRQRTVSKDMLGRVVAVTRMMSYASIPIGAFLGGKMLSIGLSMGTVIVVGGVIRTLTGFFASLSPLGKEE